MSQDSPRRGRGAIVPAVEGLEGRWLLASGSFLPTPQLLNEGNVFIQFTDDLRAMERKSKATPAESLALRDDARAISQDAATTALPPKVAAGRAEAVTVVLNRAALDGWMNNEQWSLVETRLDNNLAGLNVPPSLAAKTIGDMEALAASAHVTSADYSRFTRDFNQLRADENTNGGNVYGYPDPEVYLGQHLLGFFRGGAASQSADVAKLNADLKALPKANSATPSEIATVRRDAGLLQKLGAAMPSDADATFNQTYLAAFAQGVPTTESLASIQSSLITDLGTRSTPARTAQVARLMADAPAFARALGSSSANVGTIVADVQAVVDDGLGAAPDPFKVTAGGG